jgi:hypothetical protein
MRLSTSGLAASAGSRSGSGESALAPARRYSGSIGRVPQDTTVLTLLKEGVHSLLLRLRAMAGFI